MEPTRQLECSDPAALFDAVFEQEAMGMALRAIAPRNPRWLRVNQRFCDMLGFSREELLRLTSVDITLSEERETSIRHNERLQRGELRSYSREKRYLRKDGTTLWTNIWLSTVLGADGRPAQVISVIQDISRQKAIEQALHQARDQLEQAVRARTAELRDAKESAEAAEELLLRVYRSSPALFAISRLEDGRHYDVNEAWSSITGYSHDEAMRKTVLELNIWKHPEDRARFIDVVRKQGFIRNFETVYRTRHGVEKDMLLSGEIFDFQGEEGLLLVGQDITERKAAEREAIRAREAAEAADRAKTEFISNVSHELRTPLHGILSFSDLGLKRFEKASPETIRTYFENIKRSGDRLLVLINDLLDISSLSAGKMPIEFAPHDFAEIWQQAVAELQPMLERKGIRIDYRAGSVDTRLECDKHRILQVTSNILSNAIKFSPDGSVIASEVSAAVLAREGAAAVDALSISISDQGEGIRGDDMEIIFDKFVQVAGGGNAHKGTGLGLAICREIVALHRGGIHAENPPEGGARFTFTLPRAQRQD